MLVLTRKSNESIVLGENIEVTVLNINGNQVSLGFKAPKDVPIYRKEIFEEVKNENVEAAGSDKELLRQLNRKID